MSIRITILGSGSRGNAALVEAGPTRVLVDAGLSVRQIRLRAEAARGEPLDRVDAVVLTHGHGDHVGHARTIAKAWDAPVYLTEATRRNPHLSALRGVRLFGSDTQFTIGELCIDPHPIPHDAPQVALVFAREGARAALVTDLGEVQASLIDHLRDVPTLLIEANHDPALLAAGPYPAPLQDRILSGVGHLSNAQTAAALGKLDWGLREVVLMHISETNNQGALAQAAAEEALAGHEATVRLAHQVEPLTVDVGA
ncbi:MAG: MBL fold metallo-hydrolase [Deltaproteobacteria bacterium]|nr:MBL fold metallo-hydrolase [Deltaproteobacteria bacterium]